MNCESKTTSRLHTVEQLVDQHEIVLDGFFVEFPKIALPQHNEPVEELEDQCGIGIAFGNSYQVDILMLDMAEGRRAQGQDRRAYLRIGDDLDPEDVGKARAAVAAEGAKYEVLALLIEHKNP